MSQAEHSFLFTLNWKKTINLSEVQTRIYIVEGEQADHYDGRPHQMKSLWHSWQSNRFQPRTTRVPI